MWQCGGRCCNSRGRFDADESIEAFRLELDAAIWTRIIEETQIDQLMDFTERREFEAALRKDVPPATAENIFATMERLTGDADLIFKRGIARCFAKLDPAFQVTRLLQDREAHDLHLCVHRQRLSELG